MDNQDKLYVTPKDFFLNLAWLVTLYGSVVSILNLLFEVINRVWPDKLYYSGLGYTPGIRWSIAWLIVIFPIYIIVTKYLKSIYKTEPRRKDLWIRRWFVYLTLFLTSGVVVVDLIVLIQSFLGGELTTRFLLKVLCTLIIAVLVFSYYFFDLKGKTEQKVVGNIFTVISVVLVLGAIAWAFSVIGSPKSERIRNFDRQRVSHLQDIQWRIGTYWQNKQSLPKQLPELDDDISSYVVPVDPETGDSYKYSVKGVNKFSLCANFGLEGDGETGYSQPNNDSWSHKKGEHCFDRTIDPDMYPPAINYKR